MGAEHVQAEGIRVLPPVYPLAALALGGLMQWLEPVHVSTAQRHAGLAVAAIGITLLTVPIIQQVRAGTDPNPWKDTTRLVTTGFYRYSRNPIYVGDLLIQAGIGLAYLPWALPLLPLTWSAFRYLVIAREERFLRHRFGQAYTDYVSRTHRWFGLPRQSGPGHKPRRMDHESAAGARRP